MRRNAMLVVLIFTFATLSDSWKSIWPTAASESERAAATPATRVALLDLGKVFQTLNKFQKESKVLRGEVEQAERSLVTHKAELQAAADKLAELPKGSIEAKLIEEQIARDTAEIQVSVTKQKKDFFEMEAKMYYECYQEVMAEVSKYAEQRGINLVMRFSGDPYDESDPQALQKELNKATLYHQGIDITDDIIRIVNAD